MFSDVLLTVDYDRTLTGPDATIPKRKLEAIEYFMANGGTFTVNTGRSRPMVRCFEKIVPVNAPLLVYNGSAWFDPATEKLSQCKIIDVDTEAVITDLQNRFPELTVEVQGIQNHYIFRENKIWEEYVVNNGGTWAYGDPANVEQPFLKFSLYGNFVSKYVPHMYESTPRELRLFEEATHYLESTLGDKVDAFRACPRILDVHAKGCSKLNSARTLQKTLEKKYLVCVGDAENDLPMLLGADFAYCPADGVVANRFENVCNCGDGAVADVIYKKIPGILKNNP